MNRKMRKLFILVCAVIFLAGCTFNIKKYEYSYDNVRTLRNLAPKASNKIKLNPFTSKKPGKDFLLCRGTAPVELPGQQPYEKYIEKAFLTELKMSDVYSSASGVAVNGHLEEISFSSAPDTGRWTIKIQISSPEKASFVVVSEYKFKTNSDPDKACWQVARAFVPAVQKLIQDIINHPDFQSNILGIEQ